MSGKQGDQHVETIFHEATALPASARAEYLHRACGPDSALRQRVESLLAAHEAAGDFLPPPTRSLIATPPGHPDSLPLSEQPGVVIGRYKLLQQIGEGGFGVVFMAEQAFPVRRRVALKIIKLGMDTRQVVARFEAERQALAMMDHPGVARVFDGGETETGRPYFVMELVRGTPINAYCDAHNLTIRQRLELFSQVCHAVQHAHQKGLIHRDIKPTNVLISTAEDDSPVAKVIDFGIAKAMQARLTEKTLFTDFHQWIGTPEYMSPEQTIGSLDVDTRSDMYSLGVLLYELLAGSLPFDSKELRRQAYAEMQRIIREVDPPAPSTRVSTIRDLLPAVAAHRGLDPRKLAGALRGELDWIVMRCLEKDRTRRYPTASALIDDIQRYLHDLPVEAQPAGRTYRLKKFVRRNKVAVLAGGAVVIALVCGLALATAGFVQARREAIRADREAKNAKAEFARTRRGADFFWHFMHSMTPAVRDGRDTTLVRDALDASVAKIDQSSRDTSPQSTAELCALVGSWYLVINEPARAQAMHRRALTYFQSMPGQEATQAMLLDQLVSESKTLGNYDEAETFHRDALAVSKTLSGPDSAPTAAATNRLAVLLLRHNQIIPEPIPPARSAEAETLLRQALATRTKLLGEKDALTEESRSNLMDTLQRRGKFDEADKLYDNLLQQSQRNAREHARILHTRAMLRCYGGRWAGACADLAEAQKVDPNEDRYPFDLALALRMSDRLDDYRQHCHTFLERAAGRPDSLPTADKAAKVALLLPVDGADRERACELADRVAGATEQPPGVLPWFALCKSLADLRRQRWDSAIEWAERTIASNEAARETQAAACFIEASAHAQLGRAESARSALARGQALMSQTSWNVYNESWRDWLIADLLHGQTVELLTSLSTAATRP